MVKMKLKIYPFGIIEEPAGFCDILDRKCNHIACIISIPSLDDKDEIKAVKKKQKEIKQKEVIIWDDDGYPDIYVRNKKITFTAIKKGIKMLENDKQNKFKYDLIRKNIFDLLHTKPKVKKKKNQALIDNLWKIRRKGHFIEWDKVKGNI